ncbi:MAG TPA: hypothetical protein PK129_14335 [Cellvibrionaceae bacterium]|nr:hypothetical protein [Cellvibrionaceae bacterium]
MKKLLLSLLLITAQANAATLKNADFAEGLNGWVDVSANGEVTASKGAAILSTGFGTHSFSAVLLQGDDGFFNFSDPLSLPSTLITLDFDLWLQNKSSDASETGESVLRDGLSLVFYDAENQALDKAFENLSFSHQNLDVAFLAGRSFAISFELADENDGANISVGLDNIVFRSGSVSPVPAPGALIQLAAGLMFLAAVIRRKFIPSSTTEN